MNEILIYDAIGEDYFGNGVTAKSIHDQLSGMEGDVVVRLNSPGGDVFQGTAIYNILEQYKGGKVTMVVDGLAASAASVIAMAGHLTMADNSMLMIHNPWTVAAGDAEELRSNAELRREFPLAPMISRSQFSPRNN